MFGSHLPSRVWDKIALTGRPDACWVWTGAKNSRGYGQVYWHDRMVYAHRLTYRAFKGPIPHEKRVDHVCNNRLCCNPAHLQLLSNAENILRGNGKYNGAHHRAKTHCPQGHAYPQDRVCRPCQRASAARSRAKRRAP